MRATLLGVPGSHPSLAAELMLRHKGIAYRRIHPVQPWHQVDPPVRDALVAEHQLARQRRVRGREAEQDRAHGPSS